MEHIHHRTVLFFALGQLEGFICFQSYDSLLVIGDFNIDFNHSGVNCSQLLRFMDDYDLSAVDLCYHYSINYTYSCTRILVAQQSLG